MCPSQVRSRLAVGRDAPVPLEQCTADRAQILPDHLTLLPSIGMGDQFIDARLLRLLPLLQLLTPATEFFLFLPADAIFLLPPLVRLFFPAPPDPESPRILEEADDQRR